MSKYKIYDIFNCLIIAVFTIVFAISAMNLWNYDFTVPLWYREYDNIATAIIAKRWMNMKDIFNTTLMGAPFTALNIDFPMYGEVLEWSVIKAISNIFNSYGMGINIFFVSLFPITAIISYLVMSSLNIKKYLCVIGSVLYTFMPYRFIRNTAHLSLACYWQLPLAILVMFWFYQDDEFFNIDRSFHKSKKNIVAVIFLSLVAWTGIYYTFFTAFFMVVIFIIKVIREPKNKQLYFKVVAIIVNLGIPIILASIPTKLMLMKYGENSEAPLRNPVEAEVYGMKITQLFMPNKSHGIKLLDKINAIYASAPLPNEGSEYLGYIGIIGFVILIIALFCKIDKKRFEEIEFLSKLNLASILLGTIGGIGSLFALFVSPQIRAYNRISIFIAYFSILAVCIGLTEIYESIKMKRIVTVFICIAFIIGLWDQTFYYTKEEMQQYIDSYYSDNKFVDQIESQVSEGAMIYQMPFQRYPEGGGRANVGDYGLARGYLHSDTLRWSYGDQKGRIGDRWNVAVSKLSIQDTINIITFVGFEGIYLDTLAFYDDELELTLNQISEILGVEPTVSENGRLMFYNVNEYIKKMQSFYSEEEWDELKNGYLEIIPRYSDDFLEFVENGKTSYSLYGENGILKLENITDIEKSGIISCKISNISTAQVNLRISIGGDMKEYIIDAHEQEIQLYYTIEEMSSIEITFTTGKTDEHIRISDIKIK